MLLLVPVSFELIGALLGVLAHGAVAVLPPAKARPAQLLQLARRGQMAAIVLARSPGLSSGC